MDDLPVPVAGHRGHADRHPGTSLLLTRKEADAIDARIARLEARTGVQVVAAVVAKCDAYPEIVWKAFALGAAIDNDYYYGPYGWHGGVYMYNDAWDDWYDAREDAREDWIDHREDLVEERGDRSAGRAEEGHRALGSRHRQVHGLPLTVDVGTPLGQPEGELERGIAQGAGERVAQVAGLGGALQLEDEVADGHAADP